MRRLLAIILIPSLLLAVDYNSEIQPIFNSNCTNCHNTGSSSYGNHELDLTSYQGLMDGGESGPVVIPGNSSSSILWQEVEDGDMPDNNSELSSSDVDLIADWINEGALEFEFTCDDGFILIEDIPVSCIVFDESDCFYEDDIDVLVEIAESNDIFDLDPLYLGTQNWLGGRFRGE